MKVYLKSGAVTVAPHTVRQHERRQGKQTPTKRKLVVRGWETKRSPLPFISEVGKSGQAPSTKMRKTFVGCSLFAELLQTTLPTRHHDDTSDIISRRAKPPFTTNVKPHVVNEVAANNIVLSPSAVPPGSSPFPLQPDHRQPWSDLGDHPSRFPPGSGLALQTAVAGTKAPSRPACPPSWASAAGSLGRRCCPSPSAAAAAAAVGGPAAAELLLASLPLLASLASLVVEDPPEQLGELAAAASLGPVGTADSAAAAAAAAAAAGAPIRYAQASGTNLRQAPWNDRRFHRRPPPPDPRERGCVRVPWRRCRPRQPGLTAVAVARGCPGYLVAAAAAAAAAAVAEAASDLGRLEAACRACH